MFSRVPIIIIVAFPLIFLCIVSYSNIHLQSHEGRRLMIAKSHAKMLSVALSAVLLVAMQLTGCGGGGSDGGGGGVDTFTNGGATLTTSVTGTAAEKTVTVADADGVTTLTLKVTTAGVTMSAPGETDAVMTFHTPLAEMPTDYTVRRMAIYVAGIRATNADLSSMPDSPGCDWFPDTQCTLGCCADHDQCYRANSCGASSWIWGFGTEACKNCNNIAYDCIAAACVGVTESFLANNCYDAKCNEHYDCPPNYNSCTCLDICVERGYTVPETCGNGQCIIGEDVSNCYNDCAYGTSLSQCCVDTGNCPSETEDTCPGSCCCCGVGFTCNGSSMCASGDFF